jgi:hypothetical protein
VGLKKDEVAEIEEMTDVVVEDQVVLVEEEDNSSFAKVS